MISAYCACASAAPAMPGARWCSARHGVEQVREAARAARQRLDAVFVAAQRVAELHAGSRRRPAPRSASMLPATSGASVISRIGAIACRLRQSSQRHRPREVGLRAELAGVDVRPFQVHAQHARAARGARWRTRRAGPRTRASRSAQRRRHGGGQQRRRAVAAWHCATRAAASPPSMMSRPPPPCTCRSMKPGSTSGCVRFAHGALIHGRAGDAADAAGVVESMVPATKPCGPRMWPFNVRFTGQW